MLLESASEALYSLCHWNDCISSLSVVIWQNSAAVLAKETSKLKIQKYLKSVIAGWVF